MEESFEREVIDRLARIETEQKQIRTDIADFKNLELRVSTLEAENNKRKGISSVFSAIWGLIGVITGSVVAYLLGRFF